MLFNRRRRKQTRGSFFTGLFLEKGYEGRESEESELTYLERKKEENESVKERFYLAYGRGKEMEEELIRLKKERAGSCLLATEEFSEYFLLCTRYLLLIAKTYLEWENGSFAKFSVEVQKERSHRLYEDIAGENYAHSYADPAYAREKLGETFSGMLCYLYAELRELVSCAYAGKLWDITVLFELFLEIYQLFYSIDGAVQEEKEVLREEVFSAIYYHERDYLEPRMEQRIREQLCVEESQIAEWLMEADLSNPDYLYLSGEYVTENEIASVELLNSFSDEEIEQMAQVYTQGYRKGFENSRIDLSEKKTVNIRYSLGFERLVRAAIRQFAKMGLSPVIYRSTLSSMNRKLVPSGFFGSAPNKQFYYDHRHDCALYLDRPYLEQRLDALRRAYRRYEKEAAEYAGPAVIEIFGETPFEPISKGSAICLDEKKQKLYVELMNKSAVISNEYIDHAKTSFTIIAYPVQEIGKNFHDIFRDTVRVNSLDMDVYREIQQKLIDALDQGERVHVTGRNGNRTDLWISLFPLADPEKETCFENCLADVNIPLGEVFTSPKLKGTDGLLHVQEVYLEGVKYKDLALHFSDGMVTDYDCAAGKKQVFENILASHDTLPMGEFAIGTNTTAYAMGKKYEIFQKLPILIAEKMGPHFAVGDTCYSMAEDVAVYNPDGKEIVARENACSALRKVDMQKAYFNCHTDITIPYSELGDITVHAADGTETALIRDGRFVLLGTERLNEAMGEIS